MALINALTTLANAKMIAGIPATVTTYDASIELLINRVSGIVKSYLCRDLTRSTYTEVLSATARQLLILKEYPIISITTLYSKEKLLVLDTDYRLDAQDKARGVVYKENGWEPINLVSGLTMDVQAAARTIDIVYIAGYYLPADALYVEGSESSLPIEIQAGVDEMVAQKWMRIKTNSYGLDSYSEGGISYGFRKDTTASTVLGISDEHAMALNPFKRFVVA
jgi:hypothetical protein